MKIQVTIKNVYGTEKVYPHCEKAKCFARIAGTETLTMRVLKEIGALGFYVETVHVPRGWEVAETSHD